MFCNAKKGSMVPPVCFEGFSGLSLVCFTFGLSPSMFCNCFVPQYVLQCLEGYNICSFVTQHVLQLVCFPVCFEGFDGLSPCTIYNWIVPK